jgi:MFS family permease
LAAILRAEANGYWQRIQTFSPNAKLLIASNVTRAFGRGFTQAIFNLYLLALGFSKTFLGGIMGLNAFAMAIFSLILGPYVFRVGSKKTLILGVLIATLIGFSQVAYPVPEVLLMGAILSGLGSSLLMVGLGPFFTAHSTPYERTHLFGASQSFTILSSFISNTIAGLLPGWFTLIFMLPLDSPPTFQFALLIHVIPLALSIIPLLMVQEIESETGNPEELQPQINKEPKERKSLLLQFALVNMFIGFGAGFVIPYLNVFFWEFYNLPTALVGFIQGLGSLSVAMGVFLAPVLSNRIGKVKTVVVSQGLSLPFLVAIALIINPYIAIASYILRVVLMNAAMPVDNTLRMESVPQRWRANMSAISSFSWNFPWAISTQITGPLFDQGFYLVPFWFTFTCYGFSTILYMFFFRGIEAQLAKEKTEANQVQ